MRAKVGNHGISRIAAGNDSANAGINLAESSYGLSPPIPA
jgi:hypothetical protein